MDSKYNPKKIEAKWQKYWAEKGLYKTSDKSSKPKFYVLDMFPYPSGAGIHMGHVESYAATDIISRYHRMKGENVLHPQGWDAFGLPAENYAIKTKVHPRKTTRMAIKNFKRQIKSLGLSYDWSREIDSSDPAYYKWTQWFFLLLYKNKLAYKKKAKVNWCESCKTVLANEQVIDGKCERCGKKIIQKDLEQWFFKITDFIEDKKIGADTYADLQTSGLISGLNKIDWPESTKMLQRNWIGRSEGATVKFEIKISNLNGISKNQNLKQYLETYTTRLDTIFGCTYCVIAPENPIVEKLKDKIENYKEVEEYVLETKKRTDLDRMEAKDKSGIEVKGLKAINPFTKEEAPIFVADYVLGHYGTGAVMAVPAHDTRDYEFSVKYKLPVKKVIDDGILANSEKYSGLTSEEARERMTKWLEKNELGGKKINYKLRDWLVSRQRYWGAPIPIIYCEKCGVAPVPEKDLPVRLPNDVDFKPAGESPLKYSKKFQDVKCPKCGAKAKRESDTMDTFVCSSWYYLRYADPKNNKEPFDKFRIKKWLPVDIYVGGAEHSVLHLLYARFFTKVLHNLGYINFDEPFLKLRHQGTILAPDGNKMSKSKGNVVNPDDVIKKWGADTLRLFEMFMGPLEDAKLWQTEGIVGMFRFLEKIYKLSFKCQISNGKSISNDKCQNKKLNSLVHRTIKKVTEDIENFRFNTAISALMILANEMEKQKELQSANYKPLIILLSPFAPHIAEELWNKLGNKGSLFKEKWPEYDPRLIKDEEIKLVIQVNGKTRDKIKASADISEEEAKNKALASEKIRNYVKDKKIKKIIFVKGRLINVVI